LLNFLILIPRGLVFSLQGGSQRHTAGNEQERRTNPRSKQVGHREKTIQPAFICRKERKKGKTRATKVLSSGVSSQKKKKGGKVPGK